MEDMQLTRLDTTRAYRQTLLDITTKQLDGTFFHLLGRLNDINITTPSSPPRASDDEGLPKKLTIADKAERTAEKLFRPLGKTEVPVARERDHGGTFHEEQMLMDALSQYEARHAQLTEEIRKLEATWETIVGEIWKVGVKCLGEDTMFALLLTKPAPPPPPPVKAERHSMMLAELDIKPARKKVKFEEPALILPEFLSFAPRFPELPVPEQMSKDEVKMLQGKVNNLGTEQIEALAKVIKDGEKWWEKKQAQMMMALQTED